MRHLTLSALILLPVACAGRGTPTTLPTSPPVCDEACLKRIHTKTDINSQNAALLQQAIEYLFQEIQVMKERLDYKIRQDTV